MKKICVCTCLIVCSLCVIFAGCKPDNYRGLNFGKYYLENSDDVYIEIMAEHSAVLNNLDFLHFDPEEYWGEDKDWTEGFITNDEVLSAMQGEKNYWYYDDGLLCFEVKANGALVYQISFNYNGSNELKSTYNNDIYTLRK